MNNGNDPFIKAPKWLLLALCIKLLLYFIFILPDNNPNRKFSGPFIRSADHSEYISPIDNLIEKGVYAANDSYEPYAGRLPGFVFPYIVFRVLFSEAISNILLGIFILLLSIIASYSLGLLLYRLTLKRWAFLAGFLLLNLVPYSWHYDWTLHTSSLGISCFIFCLFYYHKYTIAHLKRHLLYAGFFLSWLVLLRGFCLIYIPIFFAALLLHEKKFKHSLKQIFKSSLIFLLPLIIFESMWITRNFISLHKFVPLQTLFIPGSNTSNAEYGYRSITKFSMVKVREMIFTWGGENAWYFPDSDISWFAWKGGKGNSDFKFDETIFYEGLTLDTLKALRETVLFSYRDSLTASQHDSIENRIIATSNRLKEKFKKERSAYFYFKAPIKRLKNYLFRNVTQDWPGPMFAKSNIFQKGLRFVSILLYALLLIQVILFPFVYWRKRRMDHESSFYLLIYVLLLSSLLPFMFVIPMSHYTYFIFGFTTLIPIFVYNLKAFRQ